jgi:putative salt-induced outer membrane protein
MIRTTLLAAALAAAMPGIALAGPWTGAAEFGLAISSGNADTETLNGKVDVKREDEKWLYSASAAALRVKSDDDLTANRYELGGKAGYKFNERLYAFGSARYDNDDFAPFEYQIIVGAGLGYFFIKDATTELSGEVGPGWRRFQPIDLVVPTPPPPRRIEQDSESDLIARAAVNFKHKLTDSTEIFDTLLVESGGGNTFLQNDIGVAVKISDRFALKLGHQLRRNNDAPPGVDKTDTLITTNLVATF